MDLRYDLLDRKEFKDNDRKTIMIVIALELYKLVSSLLQVSRYMYESISSKYVYEADDEWLNYTSSNPVPFVTPCNYVKCNGKCINIMKPVNGIDTMIYPKVKKILSDKLIVPDLCDIVGSYMSPTFESPIRTLIYDLILDNEMDIDILNII